ncbi:MAG: sensor histidine kinase [Anaerolineae bacterium]
MTVESSDLELREEHRAHLDRIARTIGPLADISRADVLLYAVDETDRVTVVAQARPHSVPPIHEADVVGQVVNPIDNPTVFRALSGGHYVAGKQGQGPHGAMVAQEVFTIEYDGQVIGALGIEKTLIEHERHQRRATAFQKAVRNFQWAVSMNLIPGLDEMSSFGEYDGILVVDAGRHIQYASGLANNLYRRLGAMDLLPGQRLSMLRDSDDNLVERALEAGRCLEAETEEGAFIWVKRAIPLYSPVGWRSRLPWEPDAPHLVGALFTIHDATKERKKQQLLKLREAMLEELQHRVKNSIQTIISLLRMQARRAKSEETRHVLEESITRLLAVAAVHDFLYNPGERIVDLKALSGRILQETAKGIIGPGKKIDLALDGPTVYLPAHQATPCALVINELLLNALEHGYADQPDGKISITLRETFDDIVIEIQDDGSGLPDNFDAQKDGRLGLSIVRSLVEDGLAGHFKLRNRDGVAAIVTFPKAPTGDESWSELE